MMSLIDGLPPHVRRKIEENYFKMEERVRRFYERRERKENTRYSW